MEPCRDPAHQQHLRLLEIAHILAEAIRRETAPNNPRIEWIPGPNDGFMSIVDEQESGNE